MENKSKTIWEALLNFQKSVPIIEKNKEGQAGHRKFMYADLTTIWSTIKCHLQENDLVVFQPIINIEKENYIKTIIAHTTTGETLESTIKITFSAKDIKEEGTYITYYRRYALCSTLCLIADEDADDYSFAFIVEQMIKDHPDIRSKILLKYKRLDKIPNDNPELILSSINKMIEDKIKTKKTKGLPEVIQPEEIAPMLKNDINYESMV